MTALGKALPALAVAASLLASNGVSLAGTNGQHVAMSSGTPAGTSDFHHYCGWYGRPCPKPIIVPTCKGPHKGPNGVWIQCD